VRKYDSDGGGVPGGYICELLDMGGCAILGTDISFTGYIDNQLAN
jgi:hypothetical protein